MQPVDTNTDFNTYFNRDNLIDIFEDVKDNYINLIPVHDYKFKPAELILPNLYTSKFGIENESISEIKEQSSDYFFNKLMNRYNGQSDKYDMSINLQDGETIQVKLVKTLPILDTKIYLEEDGDNMNRIGKDGRTLYSYPKNLCSVGIENGVEVIYVKAVNYVANKDVKNSYFEINNQDGSLANNLINILKSFKNNVSSVIPHMATNIETKKLSKEGKLNNTTLQGSILSAFTKYYNLKID